MLPTREEALKCSDKVVERGRMCAGCYGDAYCEVSKKFAKAYPERTLLRDVILLVVTGGRSYYEGRR